jgi:hypothetical protein
MNRTTTFFLVLLVLAIGPPAYPQAGQLRALAIRYQQDLEQLKSYSWKSRTEITVEGETQEISLLQMRHDADGKLQQAPIGDDTGGPPRKRRSTKIQTKAAKFMEDLRALIPSYTRFTPKQMHTVYGDAKVFPEEGDAAGQLRVQIRGVVRQGDSMYIWADIFNHQLRKLEINTSLDGQPVKVITEYRDLEDGPTHPARTTVRTELKRKPTVITTENFDYVRPGE